MKPTPGVIDLAVEMSRSPVEVPQRFREGLRRRFDEAQLGERCEELAGYIEIHQLVHQPGRTIGQQMETSRRKKRLT